MKPYTDYRVRLGDLKKAIVENPYDPTKNIEGYLRYLKYNTPECATREGVIRCKDCKHWLPHTQFGFDYDNGEYHNYCEMHLPDDDYYAFEKNANDYCSLAKRKESDD